MRSVHVSDVLAVARALRAVPEAQRQGLCAEMIREAELADRYMRRLGKPHPHWGNGTLRDTARRRPMGDALCFDDPQSCRCMAAVMHGLGIRPRSAHL
ncbi:hypothetical protein AB2B41_03000 [Marimonas sp. MJW-29]|uniref:DUF7742 domain-containing protein n=1 Tax=Sulfitobacter sediminis TaxID=3234186 RepID=A0ABV3RHW9_9RHOB